MRVTFNTNMADLQQAISVAAADMAVHRRELSTGRRVNVPSDDPNAASAAVAERSEMAATDQYQASANSVTSRLSVVDSVLSGLINLATSAQSATFSARGSTAKPAQIEAAADQLESIRDAVMSAMNTTFRGTYLFSGNEPTVAPYHIEIDGTISGYQGGSGTVDVNIDRQATVQIGFSSDQILMGTDGRDLIQVLDDLANAVRSGDDDALEAGSTALNSAFTRLTTTQTRVGNDMAQIDAHRQQLTARRLGSLTRLSTLEDADLSKSITDMNRADVAYQAALRAVGTATKLTLMDYLT